MSNHNASELAGLLREIEEREQAELRDDNNHLRAENQALRQALSKAEAEGKAFRTAFYDLHNAVTTVVTE